MSNPRENAALVEEAKRNVQEHCMCARFTEADGYYTVIYPEGMYPDGARASQGGGKAVALNRLLVVMERHWNENGIHG